MDTEDRNKAQPAIEPEPMYSCQASTDCAAEVSYPADMLAVFDGKVVCENCWTEEVLGQDLWSDLPRFVPAHERRITKLESAGRALVQASFLKALGLQAAALRALAKALPENEKGAG